MCVAVYGGTGDYFGEVGWTGLFMRYEANTSDYARDIHGNVLGFGWTVIA